MADQENPNPSIFGAILDVTAPMPAADGDDDLTRMLRGLSHDQLRYIALRITEPNLTKSEAAAALQIKRDTVYHWPASVDAALHLVALDQAKSARAILRHTLVKAVLVKVAGLDSADEEIRQRTATQIIEWILGRAKQQTDITGSVDVHDYRSDVFGLLFKNVPALNDPSEDGNVNPSASGLA